MYDALLRGRAVPDIADIADIDGGAVDGLYRQVVEGGDRRGGIIEVYRILRRADFDVAGGDDLVLGGDGIGDVLGGKLVGLQRLRVNVHLDLPDFAAIGVRDGDAGDSRQRRTHEVEREVENLLL